MGIKTFDCPSEINVYNYVVSTITPKSKEIQIPSHLWLTGLAGTCSYSADGGVPAVIEYNNTHLFIE